MLFAALVPVWEQRRAPVTKITRVRAGGTQAVGEETGLQVRADLSEDRRSPRTRLLVTRWGDARVRPWPPQTALLPGLQSPHTASVCVLPLLCSASDLYLEVLLPHEGLMASVVTHYVMSPSSRALRPGQWSSWSGWP